jgi:hypothetical protein
VGQWNHITTIQFLIALPRQSHCLFLRKIGGTNERIIKALPEGLGKNCSILRAKHQYLASKLIYTHFLSSMFAINRLRRYIPFPAQTSETLIPLFPSIFDIPCSVFANLFFLFFGRMQVIR